MSALSPNTSPKVRRKQSTRRRAGSNLPPYNPESTNLEKQHREALVSIRNFLSRHSCYDAFPVSFRLLVLDTKLNVQKALQILLFSNIVSAPLWNSDNSTFAGMLTVLDIIHLIQYYYRTASYDYAAENVEHFRLESLRDIEDELGVAQPPLHREHPSSSLLQAASRIIETHARRLPLLDHDTETGHEVIVSVLTQYRLLKFISINCSVEVAALELGIRRLKIGTYVTQPPPDSPHTSNPYYPLATATLNTPVFDVVHIFSERSISAVPIIDEEGIVVNIFETVDVMTLVRMGAYQSLDLTIAEAINQRDADFDGVVICSPSDSLATLLQLIKQRRTHRLIVTEGDASEEVRRGGKRGRLLGIITLSDVLRHLVGKQAAGDAERDDDPNKRAGPSSNPTLAGRSSPVTGGSGSNSPHLTISGSPKLGVTGSPGMGYRGSSDVDFGGSRGGSRGGSPNVSISGSPRLGPTGP